MASYVETNLQIGERIAQRGRLHPIIFFGPFALFVSSVLTFAWAVRSSAEETPALLVLASIVGVAVSIFRGLAAVVRWATTEMAVTDRRIIVKGGFIARRALELRLDRVEAVSVDQGVLGRLLGYGSVTVVGTGGTHEPFADVADPLAFRGAITQLSERATAHPYARAVG